MRKTLWAIDGNKYYLAEEGGPSTIRLEPSIYMLRDSITQGLHLIKTDEKFGFPYKIYGKDSSFVQRVAKTYAMTKGNLGILLNGIKGTGKTVTAELICNELNLPIIVVTFPHAELPGFINSIQHEAIVLFDEYEKIYVDKDKGDILTVMDGVLTTKHRKVFIMTTNNTHINDNLLQRPGRIRYHKTYGNLEPAIVEEIVDDLLAKKEFKPELLEFISSLEIITIDIVKTVIQEVNIHGEPPTKFSSILNVKILNPIVNIYRIDKDDKGKIVRVEIASDTVVYPTRITSKSCDGKTWLRSSYENLGVITRVLGAGEIEVENKTTTKKFIKDEEGKKKKVDVVVSKKTLYKIEKSTRIHSSYDDEFDY